MPRTVLKMVTAAASLLAIVVVSPVISEFFIELARENGWYQSPSQRIGAAVIAFNAFVSQPWFISLSTFFVGLAIGMWIDTLLRRSEKKHDATVRDDISLLAPFMYIGEMNVSDTHLVDDLFLEITTRGFNAAIEPIVLEAVRGHITCRDERLPPPNLLIERGPRDGIIRGRSEFIVVLEQRVPRTVADQLSSIPHGTRVPLYLDNLDIIVTLQFDRDTEFRLPIYDGMMLYRDGNRLLVSRIINASMTSGALAGMGATG